MLPAVHARGHRYAGAVRGVRRSFARPCASVTVALALVLCVPATSRGREVATSAAGAMPRDPTPAERKAYSALRDEMDQAAKAGDWDLFLSKAGQALDKLPEHASSEGTRREVVGLVGKHEIDQRNEPQIERSVDILDAYKDQLRLAYGDAAKLRRGWDDAERYVGVLRRRFPDAAPPPTGEPPRAAPTPSSSTSSSADTLDAPERNNRVGPLVVSGAVLTGLGGVLLLAGLAFVPGSKTRFGDHDDLARGCERDGLNPCPGESAAYREFLRWRGRTLGLAIPGVVLLGIGVGLLVAGLRRKQRGPDRTFVTRDGVRIRF